MPEESIPETPKHKHYRKEAEACDWSVVYKCETENKCLSFGCRWNWPLPAAE